MMRFFVDKKVENYFILNKEVLQHIKVSRVTNKEFICVFEGKFYVCILENNLAKILKQLNQNHEFNGEVILAAALINIKKFELLIQKACELGATRLIPVISQNVEQKISGDLEKKIQRWNQISVAAAEQSFRNFAMEVTKPQTFQEVIKIPQKHKYIAHEKINDQSQEKNFSTNSIFLVGPEGGFTQEEFIGAQQQNYLPISLGKRILRAETASIYILAKVTE